MKYLDKHYTKRAAAIEASLIQEEAIREATYRDHHLLSLLYPLFKATLSVKPTDYSLAEWRLACDITGNEELGFNDAWRLDLRPSSNR